MKEASKFGTVTLHREELLQIRGGSEPMKGSYALGYTIGAWFNEMYDIWYYGLTHLDER